MIVTVSPAITRSIISPVHFRIFFIIRVSTTKLSWRSPAGKEERDEMGKEGNEMREKAV